MDRTAEQEAIDELLAAIDRANLPDNPRKAHPHEAEAYAYSYGLALYRVAAIKLAAENLRRVQRRSEPDMVGAIDRMLSRQGAA